MSSSKNMQPSFMIPANASPTNEVIMHPCFDSQEDSERICSSEPNDKHLEKVFRESTNECDAHNVSSCEADEDNEGMDPSSGVQTPIIHGSDFHRMLLELIVKYPQQMQTMFLPKASRVKVSSSTKVMALEEDRQFAFIAFTAAVAAMASIEQQHDIQLHQSQFDDCDSGALRTFSQGTQQSDDYFYYSQDPSVDDADPFLKRRDSFRPSLPRRDTISKRGTCFRIRAFHGRQTSSLSAATEDSYETNNGFDFGADIKIASLEEQLDDQQEEIVELHEEIKKQKYLNHRLANDLNAVKSKIFCLENNYALLTVDLASAQSALDDQAVAAQATLAKADLQLLEVSLDLQNCVQERTSITKKMDKMQKQITRLEKSIEDKDVRYRKAVEEHEIEKDILHGLCHERDRLLHQLETVVKLDNEVTVEETFATYEKGRRWIRSGFINRFQVRNPRKKPEDNPLPGATVQ